MELVNRFDKRYTSYIRSLPPSWRPLMRGLSIIGEPWLICTLGLTVFLIAAGLPRPAIERGFAYAGIAYGFNIVLKLVLHRRRPHGRIIRTFGVSSYSFPSGHAFGSVLLYGLLADIALKHISHPANFIVGFAVTSVIVLTGISRVYLGSHYPSDVIAGWILGAISLGIVIRLAF